MDLSASIYGIMFEQNLAKNKNIQIKFLQAIFTKNKIDLTHFLSRYFLREVS